MLRRPFPTLLLCSPLTILVDLCHTMGKNEKGVQTTPMDVFDTKTSTFTKLDFISEVLRDGPTPSKLVFRGPGAAR